MNPVAVGLLERDIYWVFHMTHVDNVIPILQTGLLSRREIQRRRVEYRDISNQAVQRFRADREIFGVTPLHEFIPFHFAWFTSMQRDVEKRGSSARDALVFLDVRVDKLAELKKSICFTTDNAAKHRIEPSNDWTALDAIEWAMVKRIKTRETPPKRALMRAAELLVSSPVPPECIGQVVCRSQLTRWRLDKSLRAAKLDVPVVVEARRFLS